MIKTERLIIRPFTLQDRTFLFELNNDQEVNRYRSSDSATMAYCVDSINDWNAKFGEGLLNVYQMAIIETQEPIGLIGIFKRDVNCQAELGYRMMPKYWGKGYCKEATKALIMKYFSQTSEEIIFAETHPENMNSIRFLEHNRFIEEPHELANRGKLFYTYRNQWLECS